MGSDESDASSSTSSTGGGSEGDKGKDEGSTEDSEDSSGSDTGMEDDGGDDLKYDVEDYDPPRPREENPNDKIHGEPEAMGCEGWDSDQELADYDGISVVEIEGTVHLRLTGGVLDPGSSGVSFLDTAFVLPSSFPETLSGLSFSGEAWEARPIDVLDEYSLNGTMELKVSEAELEGCFVAEILSAIEEGNDWDPIPPIPLGVIVGTLRSGR